MALSPQPIVILGAGGFGREVLDVIEAANRLERTWHILGFVDDGQVDTALLDRRGARLLGNSEVLRDLDAQYVIGIGSPKLRRLFDERCAKFGLQAASVVHPTATFGADFEHGPGFVATAHVSVTTNIRFGRHVHLNLNSTVGHDCTFGDFVTINPGANVSGNVHLDDDVTIGTGGAVIEGKHVGARTTVGAGAVVTTDLPADCVAVGIPAKPR